MKWFAISACALVHLAAQDLTPRAKPQRRPIAIEHATVHTVSHGTLTDSTVWFADGKLAGIGQVPSAPDVERIDGKGLHVYPGLISACTQLGLIEIDLVRATNDRAELGMFTPEVRAGVAVNPDSALLPVTRSNGILVAGVFPLGGLVPGRASVIQLEGWTSEEMTLLPDAGTVVQWPTLTLLRRVKPEIAKEARERTPKDRLAIDELFATARSYLARRGLDNQAPTDIRLEALGPVLARTRPVFLRAESREDIESSVAWATRQGLRAVILGGSAAADCAEILKAHDVAVVVTGTHRLPSRDDEAYDAPFTLPARLHAAGIRFCLANSTDFWNERNLPYEAATAVAHGLDPEVALCAITLAAAQILGVDERVGSLDLGKDATLLVTDGDPLDLNTRVLRAFIGGRELDLRNKQTELAKKYRARYGK